MNQLEIFRDEKITVSMSACTLCSRPIATIEDPKGNTIVSDFRDKQGRCFACSRKKT